MDCSQNQRFLDRAVHDLRSALRGIAAPAAMLSAEWSTRFDDEAKGRLAMILDGVSRIETLAKSLADYSMAQCVETSSFAALPLASAFQVAQAALRARIQETKAAIHCAALPSVAADHGQLAVLFRCLLSNSLEYRSAANPAIEVGAVQSGNDWNFAVRDNGVGISPQYFERIFQPFERLQRGTAGAGLGLTICKAIVEGHGGRIWVESQENQGATFFFTLPAEVSV
jgi:light-regulated signal transduction histidine kinase (bacteriophytochrome)